MEQNNKIKHGSVSESPYKAIVLILFSDIVIFLGLAYESYLGTIDYYTYWSLLLFSVAGAGVVSFTKLFKAGTPLFERILGGLVFCLLPILAIYFYIIGYKFGLNYALSLLLSIEVIFIFSTSVVATWAALSTERHNDVDEIEKSIVPIILILSISLVIKASLLDKIIAPLTILLLLSFTHIKIMYWYWYTCLGKDRPQPTQNPFEPHAKEIPMFTHSAKFILLTFLIPISALVLGIGLIVSFS